MLIEKKRHPLSTQILLYGITTCWGTIFEKVEIVKKKNPNTSLVP